MAAGNRGVELRCRLQAHLSVPELAHDDQKSGLPDLGAARDDLPVVGTAHLAGQDDGERQLLHADPVVLQVLCVGGAVDVERARWSAVLDAGQSVCARSW